MRVDCFVVFVLAFGSTAALIEACPPLPEDSDAAAIIQTDRTWGMLAPKADRVVDSGIKVALPNNGGEGGLAGGSAPSDVGMWTPPFAFPVIAINASLLHTGEVLAYAYPGAQQARVWNPISETFQSVNMGDDIFCSGQTQLADGRVFVAGGNQNGCDFKGIVDTNIFDPVTRTWTAQPNMTNGRWYPTVVTMPDGRALIFSGLDLECENNPVVEMFTPGVGLSIVPEGERNVDLYPRMHVLSNGKIAHVAPENSARTFQPGVGWQFVDWNNFGWRGQSTSVMLPGFTDRIMVIGANSPVSNTTEIIDFTQPSPQFVNGPSMHHARAHMNATILPNKKVLVIGGGQSGQYGSPVLTPEMYDPVAQTWTLLPSHVHSRMYHSTAVLLPDGRVLSAGQDSGPGANTGEIYSPPYLFRGPRPVVTSTVKSVGYGQEFAINSPDSASVESVVMIKLGNVTHSVTFDQRLIELNFVEDGPGRLAATAPANANLATPGYYMLFAINGNETPSFAKFIRIGATPTADVSGDGAINVTDLLAVISSWGACGAAPVSCIADVNNDGTANVTDLLLVIAQWGS